MGTAHAGMKGLNSHITSLSHRAQTVRYGRTRVVSAAGGYSRNDSSIHNDDKQFFIFDRQMHVAYSTYHNQEILSSLFLKNVDKYTVNTQ